MIKFESERHLEDFIYNHWDETGICLIDGDEYDHCVRQLSLDPYGISDLIFCKHPIPIFDKDKVEVGMTMSRIVIVELKNEAITSKHMDQALRYHTCLANSVFDGAYYQVETLLVGPSVSNSLDCFTYNFTSDSFSIITFNLCPKSGIKFYTDSKTYCRKGEVDAKFISQSILGGADE